MTDSSGVFTFLNQISVWLAQTDSSNMSDFLKQISGLLALTCAAGIIWIALMAVIAQRAAIRRRRAKEGLPPLPSFYVTAYQWLVRQFARTAPPAEEPAAQRDIYRPGSVLPPPPMPTPDLAMLMGDLPAPDLETLLPDQKAAAPIPEVPPAAYALDREPSEQAVPVDELLESIEATEQAAEPFDSVEVLRVWRDLGTGSLIVEIGGQRFESLYDLRSAEVERRFLNVLHELDGMAKIKRPPADAPASSPPPTVTREPAPPSMSAGTILRQMTRVAMGQTPEPVEKLPPERTIADQIENLLQARLANLPALDKREIHVRPSLEGGVRIEVDGQTYEGVGEIVDPQVRDLLLDVVREWESHR